MFQKPRLKPGVPASLARTCLKPKGCQAILHTFPTWNMQEEGKCDAIQSAIDLVLEPKDTLWVLDTGIVDSLTQQEKRCRPKVVAFDVKTGEVSYVINTLCPYNHLNTSLMLSFTTGISIRLLQHH